MAEVASWEQCTLLLWEVVLWAVVALWEELEVATLAVLVLEAALRSGTLQLEAALWELGTQQLWEVVSLVAMG